MLHHSLPKKKNPSNSLKNPWERSPPLPLPMAQQGGWGQPSPLAKSHPPPSSQHSPRRRGALPGAQGTPPLGVSPWETHALEDGLTRVLWGTQGQPQPGKAYSAPQGGGTWSFSIRST